MESFGKLSDVIGLLLSKGYTIDFAQLTKAEKGFYKTHVDSKPLEDFRINEIFFCKGKFETDKAIYVFAISSERHRLKRILTNGYSGNSSDFWNSFSQALERLKRSLSQLLSTYELSRERQ
jgi:hypothetical protein